jgi:ribosomal protein S18 acetylase RimI-like enzyme
MNVDLRDSDASDEKFLIELYRESRTGEFAAMGLSDQQIGPLVAMQYEARRRAYAAKYPNAKDSIILVDGEKVGRLLVAELDDEIRLVDIAVGRKFQGRRIGSTVVRRLLVTAGRAQKPVRLRVAIFNPAIHLYEREGFATIGEDAGYLLMESKPGR